MILYSSFPNLSPFRNGNQHYWTAGKNYLQITSDTSENILLNDSRPELYLGKNTFNIPSSNSYHIYGTLPSNQQRILRAVYNCWQGNNDTPRVFVYNNLDSPVVAYPYVYYPTSCIPSTPVDVSIQCVGFIQYDTTQITDYDSVDVLEDDEALYQQAELTLYEGQYPQTITHCKGLIDNFPESEYIYYAGYDMYMSYYYLDTSSNQDDIDILYSDLKQYCEAKINSGNYDEDFEDLAYTIILMCDLRLQNYNDALTGYEFIALYHPDAEIRLQASWEYDNIEEALNGMGGGLSNIEEQLSIDKRIAKIDDLTDRDPIMKRLKSSFQRVKDDRKHLKTKNETAVRQIILDEAKINERTRQNLYTTRNLSIEEKESKLFDDMKLLVNPENVTAGEKQPESMVPTAYNLSQNFPNPFNPVTKINFELPEDGKVKLIIYDILGREVIRLVDNEFKAAGRYTVEFKGMNLSSGVYFYRLEANKFVQTKRMVLIK